MKVLEVIIDKIELGEPRDCRLLFQGKVSSDISINPSNQPIFNNKKIIVPYSIDRDGKSILIVSLLVISSDESSNIKEETVGSQLVFIEPLDTGSYNKLSLILNSSHGFLMNASISLKYKVKSVHNYYQNLSDTNNWLITCNFVNHSGNTVFSKQSHTIKIKLKYHDEIKSAYVLHELKNSLTINTITSWIVSHISIDIFDINEKYITNILFKTSCCMTYEILISTDLSIMLTFQYLNSKSKIINNYSVMGLVYEESSEYLLYLTSESISDDEIINGIISYMPRDNSNVTFPSSGCYIKLNRSKTIDIANTPTDLDNIYGYIDIALVDQLKMNIYIIQLSLLPTTIRSNENEIKETIISTIISKGEINEKSRILIEKSHFVLFESKLLTNSHEYISVQLYIDIIDNIENQNQVLSKYPQLTIPSLDLPIIGDHPELLGCGYDNYPTPPETPIQEREVVNNNNNIDVKSDIDDEGQGIMKDSAEINNEIVNPVKIEEFGESVEVSKLLGTNIIPGTAISLIDMIKQEQTDKQKIIDKLLLDIDQKNIIINDANDEIRLLKDEIRQLKSRLLEAEGLISNLSNDNNETLQYIENLLNINTNVLNSLNSVALKKILIQILKKYKLLEIEKNNLLLDKNENLILKSDFLNLRKQHSQLESAHKNQSELVQNLTNSLENFEKFKLTVLLQEKIIEKLESKLGDRSDTKTSKINSKMKNKNDGKVDSMVDRYINNEYDNDIDRNGLYERVSFEFDKAMSNLKEGRDTNTDFHSHLMNIQPKSSFSSPLKSIYESPQQIGNQSYESNQQLIEANKRVEYLETEMSSKNIRISVLEEQLIQSAREHAAELSKLRTKLFEFEIASTIDLTDPKDFVNDPSFIDDKNENDLELNGTYPSGKALNAANAIRQNKL